MDRHIGSADTAYVLSRLGIIFSARNNNEQIQHDNQKPSRRFQWFSLSRTPAAALNMKQCISLESEYHERNSLSRVLCLESKSKTGWVVVCHMCKMSYASPSLIRTRFCNLDRLDYLDIIIICCGRSVELLFFISSSSIEVQSIHT